MNVCTFVGRVGQDATLKEVNGKSVANLSIAVNRNTKDSEGNYISDWFNIEVWGKSAEYAGKIKKGSLISVSGSTHINKGNDKTFVKVVANTINTIVRADQGSGGGNAAPTNKPSNQPVKQNHFDDFEDDIPPF